MKKLLLFTTLVATILYGCTNYIDNKVPYIAQATQNLEQPGVNSPEPKTPYNNSIDDKLYSDKPSGQSEYPQPIVTENISETTTTSTTTTIPPTPIYQDKINIASFNIQIFGQSKSGKPDVMDVLVDIVRRYDVVAIQEIRDATGQTIPLFIKKINAKDGPDYNYVISPRLGRTTSKEQYAFVYNSGKIAFTGSDFVYEDIGDVFEREPYIAGFKAGNFDFILVNIHTKPEDADKEITALAKVFIYADNKFANDDDVIVLGDYNADCTYFKEKADATPIETADFYWVIPDSVDTTVKSTDCTYDRIVFWKAKTTEDYAGQRGVFNFQQGYGLTQSFAEDVSDHYPVWAEFYTTKDTD